MPVPIPGPEVGSDSLKDKFLMIFGRPKTGFFGKISGAPGYIPPIPASYQPRSPGLPGGVPGGYPREVSRGARYKHRETNPPHVRSAYKMCGGEID